MTRRVVLGSLAIDLVRWFFLAITIRTAVDGDSVVIAVAGPGWHPEAIRPHIFDALFTTREADAAAAGRGSCRLSHVTAA